MSLTYHLFLDQFGESEWLPPDELRRYQERRLARLVSQAAATAPYYRDRFAGIVGDDETLDWAAWARLPILTAAEVSEHGYAMLSTAVPQSHGELAYITIDASEEGKEFPVAWTQYKALAEECLFIRLLAWHGINPGGTLAVVRRGVEETKRAEKYWSKGFQALDVTGARIDISADRDPTEILAAIAAGEADAIQAEATDIELLCEAARQTGFRRPLRAIIVTGVPPTDILRRRCRRTFGVSPVSSYDVPGIGTVALECQAVPGHHLMSDNALIELLDETGAPAKPGHAGRVVVTPFFNLAMPLLRYDTGDLAISAAPCACGRCLPFVSRIVGKGKLVGGMVMQGTET